MQPLVRTSLAPMLCDQLVVMTSAAIGRPEAPLVAPVWSVPLSVFWPEPVPVTGLTVTCAAFCRLASLPVQPSAAASILPGVVGSLSLTASDQVGLVDVATRAPVALEVPPGENPVVNVAGVCTLS